MKKINGHSISDKLILYMIKELGGIEAVVKAHKATLPVEPPDLIADVVLGMLVHNKGTVYSVDATIEALPALNQQSAFSTLQKLIRAKKIEYACASYQRQMYWVPEADYGPVYCRDCYYYEYAGRHPSFMDTSVELPSGCSVAYGGYISQGLEKTGHYCHCFRELTKADLERQENDVFAVMKKMEKTACGTEYDENDEVITKVPKRTPWTASCLSGEIPGYDTKQMDRVLARLHAKGWISESKTWEYGWDVVNKE